MITFYTVQPYISGRSMSTKSISLDSYRAPGTVPGSRDRVPVFKELITRSLFTVRILLHWKDRKTEVLKSQAVCPGHEAQSTTCGPRARVQA